MSERDISRLGVDSKPPLPTHGQHQLPNSKSVPAALHHVGNAGPSTSNLHALSTGSSTSGAGNINAAANKSRSINNLAAGDQSFYQNLSVYRNQNQSQPNLGERYCFRQNNFFNLVIYTLL